MQIVGEDTLGGEVQALAARLGISERIKFHGFVPQQRLHSLVAAADLMIMASRHEAGPVAMLEAAVVGVPTVGTAVGHIAEWAPNAAICVAVGDSSALARAIGMLLAQEEERLHIACEARRRATREDADYTARRFQALYQRLAPAG
jgi:glycosyltransferase involved in cell wall biosynthesis